MDLVALKQRFGIIGASPQLNQALTVAMQVAPTDLTVLITGESGVGKEIFSQIIHQLSTRKHEPFIAVNCGAIPEGTIDSELFGHEKGAFTGATDSRKGYFEFVNGGTIFLDEIGEMPLGTQARLLRVLETGQYIRVGSSKVQKTDVRVVAATNVNLLDLMKKGKFREDLYYRLNTVPIYVPPLRERKEDIFLLFRKFCVDFAEKHRTQSIQLTENAKKLLVQHRWPGNIRELKNIAEQVSVLSKEKVVDADELNQFLPETQASTLPALTTQSSSIGDENERFASRELLYKFFLEIKKDLTEIKAALVNLSSGNGFPPGAGRQENFPSRYFSDFETEREIRPVVISGKESTTNRFAETVEAEDAPQSLAEMEQQMIERSLDKHKGKRKDAANELGISERTLYRKIKEYGIDA